ncbi:uncharacterized protein N7498_005970, partial [Penicillium cinerascens]
MTVTLALLLGFQRFYMCSTPPSVEDILAAAPLIDGHSDFPIWIRAFYQTHIYQENFTHDPLFGQVDFSRLAQVRLRDQFWSFYVGVLKTDPADQSDDTYFEMVRDMVQQVDIVHHLIKSHPSRLQRGGPRNLPIRPNAHCHVITPWGFATRLSPTIPVTPSQTAPRRPPRPISGQSSPYSRNEPHRNAVDLAHVSHATLHNALAVTRAPVIFLYSSAFPLCPHERNVRDDMLELVLLNAGVIMFSFYPEYTCCADPAHASIAGVADHIQYIRHR